MKLTTRLEALRARRARDHFLAFGHGYADECVTDPLVYDPDRWGVRARCPYCGLGLLALIHERNEMYDSFAVASDDAVRGLERCKGPQR